MLAQSNKKRQFYQRQKVLLALLDAFGGSLSRVNMQKYLFLFTQICEEKHSYEFVPYKFGCFSFQSYADRRKLIEFEILEDDDNWVLASDSVQTLANIPDDLMIKMGLFAKKYSNLKGDNLVREVYRSYPYYATRSEIAEKLMTDEELKLIEEARPQETERAFFTIGYEGQSFENYLNRLMRNNVRLLCDVRKNPLSRKYGFSKKTLSETLAKLGIEYIHLPDLGIVADKRKELKTPNDYRLLFNEYEATTLHENKAALNQLAALTEKYIRIAITCFEAQHCMCHRSRVADNLAKRSDWHLPITHI